MVGKAGNDPHQFGFEHAGFRLSRYYPRSAAAAAAAWEIWIDDGIDVPFLHWEMKITS